MAWTRDQIESIPAVYRDFMMTLKPIIDSRQSVMTIAALPLGSVYSALQTRYNYTPQQIRTITDNLRKAGLIKEDRLSFLTLTRKGEALVETLADVEGTEPDGVPPFPDFPG